MSAVAKLMLALLATLLVAETSLAVRLATERPAVIRIPEYRESPACRAARDSFRVDSARLASQKKLAFLTFFEARRVAKIVTRDPSQLRFLAGWTNRAFVGLPMDSVIR